MPCSTCDDFMAKGEGNCREEVLVCLEFPAPCTQSRERGKEQGDVSRRVMKRSACRRSKATSLDGVLLGRQGRVFGAVQQAGVPTLVGLSIQGAAK